MCGNEYNNDDSVFTCKSGLLMPISLVCRAVYKDNILDGAVIAFRDITVQKKHLFARWGGEEFAILTPETPLDGAIKLAKKLRSKIESHDFSEPEKITTSFGVTTLKKGDNTISLINRADEALYRAKEGGRNQVVYQ